MNPCGTLNSGCSAVPRRWRYRKLSRLRYCLRRSGYYVTYAVRSWMHPGAPCAEWARVVARESECGARTCSGLSRK